MNEAIIRQEIEIDAPAAQVWPYLATEAGLRQWWGNDIRLEPKPGGRCAERTVIQGKAVKQQGVVTVYDPPRRLTLTFEAAPHPHAGALVPGGDPWPALTCISITLDEAGERTRIAVVHQVLSWVPAATLRPAAAVDAFHHPPHGPQMNVAGGAAGLIQPPIFAQAGARAALGVQPRWERRLHTLQALIGERGVHHG